MYDFKKTREVVNKEIEKLFGISYSEYEKLSIEERHKLIEKKTGKKVKPDYRLYIDGIPIDEDHILTMAEVDKKLDKIAYSLPERIIKKVKKR